MPYIGRRLLHMLFVLWAIASILFLMFRLMPGDPSTAYIDPTFTGEQRALVLAQFGLDKPLSEQYLIFLKNTVQGELGLSFRYRQPVTGLVLSVLPNTLLLTMSALFIAYAFGAFFGALLAWKRGSVLEAVSTPIVLTTRAMPDFWLGMLILAIFAFGLGWFPRAAPMRREPASPPNGPASSRSTICAISHCRASRWRSSCRACRCC